MTENKPSRLALFDFDNVIYQGHSIFDIIQAQEKDKFIENGVWDAIADLLQKYKSGQLTYKVAADQMLDVWATSLKGRDYQEIITYVQQYFAANPDKFFLWFKQLLPILSGYEIYIITTNFQFIAEAVVSLYHLHGYVSSEVEVIDGHITGKVSKTLAGNKGEAIILLDNHSSIGSLAVGDSENDIDMLAKVAIPVCFNPDKKLSAEAASKGWAVVDQSTAFTIIKELVLNLDQ